MIRTIKHVTCSAILVNYNHSAYLQNALNAALKQTVPFDEIVIIDDASTDNSVDIIKQLIVGTPYARLIQNEKNLGIEPTISIGLQNTTGDFIYFMSADDNYSHNILEWCKPIIQSHSVISMVSGNARICNSETGVDRSFILAFPQKIAVYSRQDLEVIMNKRVVTFYGGGNLIRREALFKVGVIHATLKWHADWFIYLLIACRYPFAVVPQEFIRIRQSSDQYSHACYNWKTQKLVIEAFVRLLKSDYPQEYAFFRNGGLLPTYDMPALLLLLKDKTLRHYLTPLLIWRLLTYKLFRVAGRLLPDTFRENIRRLIRM